MPKKWDWNSLAETNRKGTSASAAIAFARYVLPVPGAPSKSTPRRGEPPISSEKVSWFKNRFKVSIASRRVASAPTTSERRIVESDGRSVVCGDFPDVISGIIIIPVIITSITPSMASSGLSRMIGGIPKCMGLPVIARYQYQARGTASMTSSRVSRCWRLRSRLAVALTCRPRNTAPSCIWVISIESDPDPESDREPRPESRVPSFAMGAH